MTPDEQRRRIRLRQLQLRAQQAARPQADMSLMGRIRDNVIGVDDGVMSVGEKIGTGIANAAESASLGFGGDEASAAVDAALGRGAYDERLAHYRGNQERLRQENPVASIASEVAPALIPGLGAAKVAKGLTTAGRARQGLTVGAATGATLGFTEGEGGTDERISNAALTATLGGIFGAASPKLLDGLASVPRGLRRLFQASQERPTVGRLREVKNQAYRAVDRAGEAFSPQETSAMYQRIVRAFDEGHYVEEVDNAARAVLRNVERRSARPITLSQLDSIRQDMWRRYGNASDQVVILDAIHEVDRLIDSRAATSELMAVARAANARYAKTQLLEDAFQKAADQTASTGSGGNILNKYRQAVTAIVNEPKKARFFSDEEIGFMREFIHGDLPEEVLRRIGKLSPNGNGLMMALHTIGAISTGGATVPLMVTGAGAKSMADRRVQRGAEQIQTMLATGQRPQVPQLSNVGGATIAAANQPIERTQRRLRSRQR
ncbi:MAG: hypothetical protein AAFQ36_09465 [Pseudomonadota bacterium]